MVSTSCLTIFFKDEGELYVWGSNKHKQLVSNDDFLLKPQKIEAHYFFDEKVRKVWTGWTHMVAQTGEAS